MSDIFKKTYTVAEPGCGLTVLSIEGGEINMFGSRTVIKTSAEDVFESIKDFLHEKFVEEKADTMYYIGVGATVVYGVLAGVAIIGGVAGAVFTGGATLPFVGLGLVLAGVAFSVGDYTFNTLGPDRESECDRSWAQFYMEANEKVRQGVNTGALVTVAAGAAAFLGIYGGEMIGAMSGIIPPIVSIPAVGGTVAGALEVTAGGAIVIGLSGTAALIAAALQSGKGGGSEEGVDIDKRDSGVDISDESKEAWGKGTFDSVEDSLEYHFDKHGQEVGAKDIDQYVRKAKNFSKNLKRSRISYPKEGTPGSKTYTKNGKYITIGPDGKILTFGLER